MAAPDSHKGRLSRRAVLYLSYPSPSPLHECHHNPWGGKIARSAVAEPLVAQDASIQVDAGALEFYKSGDIDRLVTGQILCEDALVVRSVRKIQGETFVFAENAEWSRGVVNVDRHGAGRHAPPVSWFGPLLRADGDRAVREARREHKRLFA